MMSELDFAQLCQASYNGGLGFIDVEDLCFGVFPDSEKTVVVFRGTANGDNSLRDLLAVPALTVNGYIAHCGFVKAFAKLWPVVREYIPRNNIVATGHSLGGALALIMGETIGCPIVTFGCPRVYWKYGNGPVLNHTRIICDDDPVPMIPRFFYRHLNEPHVNLRDQDHEIVNVKDHGIDVYVNRLQKMERNHEP